jgi:hypothetical protein
MNARQLAASLYIGWRFSEEPFDQVARPDTDTDSRTPGNAPLRNDPWRTFDLDQLRPAASGVRALFAMSRQKGGSNAAYP